MTIKPVDYIPAPGYPDKYMIETKRALAQARPRRWQSAPKAVGVFSAALAIGLSGCVSQSSASGVSVPSAAIPGVTEDIESDVSVPFSLRPGVKKDIESITMGVPDLISFDMRIPFDTLIPLFEYGEGTGTIGCVAITMPVFMSEEEAFAILSSVLAEDGLTLHHDILTLSDAVLPVTDLYSFSNEGDPACKTKDGVLTADGFIDFGERLPVEFVSVSDINAWQGSDNLASVSVYDMKTAARTLAENNPGLVVFYDPVGMGDIDKLMAMEREEDESDESFSTRYEALKEECEQSARNKTERLLRDQAEAFVAWLRTEGIY